MQPIDFSHISTTNKLFPITILRETMFLPHFAQNSDTKSFTMDAFSVYDNRKTVNYCY